MYAFEIPTRLQRLCACLQIFSTFLNHIFFSFLPMKRLLNHRHRFVITISVAVIEYNEPRRYSFGVVALIIPREGVKPPSFITGISAGTTNLTMLLSGTFRLLVLIKLKTKFSNH